MDILRRIGALAAPVVLCIVAACGSSRSSADSNTSESEWNEETSGFKLVAPMRIARTSHGAVLLDDGRLLVGGGGSGSGDLYDFTTNQWSATAPVPLGSGGQVGATLDKLPDGSVLLIRWFDVRAWRYDPRNDIWTVAGAPSQSRGRHTVTYLPTQNRYLVVGAPDWLPGVSELFDPTAIAAQAFGEPAQLLNPRLSHAATRLADGRVLVTGGMHAGTAGGTNSCEIYDPRTNTWSPARSMRLPRANHSSTLLADGRVLVAGAGNPLDPWNASRANAEIYDPAANVWVDAPDMPAPSVGHAATLLDDGRVLLVGGPEKRTRIYDPEANTWKFGPSLQQRRWQNTLTALPDGSFITTGGTFVLVATTDPNNHQFGTGNTVERLGASQALKQNGDACSVSTECGSSFCVDGVCCESACGGGTPDCQACSIAKGGRTNGSCTIASATTECRPGRGSCDVAERCDGVAAICPPDVLIVQGTQCRGATNVCDLREVCTGAHGYCPDDDLKPTGTECNNGLPGEGFCRAGTCTPRAEWLP